MRVELIVVVQLIRARQQHEALTVERAQPRRRRDAVADHIVHGRIAGRARPAQPLPSHGSGIERQQDAWGLVADPPIKID